MKSAAFAVCVMVILSINMAEGRKGCFHWPCPQGMYCVYKSTGSIDCHHPGKEGDSCTTRPIDGFYVQFPPCGNGTQCKEAYIVGRCE
ncbi:hypothetical protein NPIL_439421 [Nephila pilipes]|uniref:Spider venom protein n=1 Tax=Nephila pilipes TaxID=299642 RepID=A0A8X6PUM4_NEPPI|nr:hypothetical protein NPIL_439421 [Nephila pilipes]